MMRLVLEMEVKDRKKADEVREAFTELLKAANWKGEYLFLLFKEPPRYGESPVEEWSSP
mgnify:CR=1 FL=1